MTSQRKKRGMKIVTWNVNGIRAVGKKGLVDIIATMKPDILCLQETKAHIEQVEIPLRTLGFAGSFWSSAEKKGYSGVATFYNDKPKSIERGWGEHKYDSEGRLVISDHGDFLLYNIYFPNGGSGEPRHLFKQQFLKDLNQHLKTVIASGREIVVVGDYNVAYMDIDVHDPKRLSKISGFLPEERDWFRTFLDLGFTDAFRHFYPNDADKYTWWDYRSMSRITNRGWRIDHICVTKGLLPKISKVEIMDSVEGSDHCPVAMTLKTK